VFSRPAVRLLLALAWLGGSAVWLVVAAVRIGRFRRLLQHAEPAPEELIESVEQLAGSMGLREAPGVWLLPGCVSPLLWAIGARARLYLPSKLWYTLDASQREALLLHELAHLRRRDHWVRSLELVVTCLYWWNPVVWLARRALREAEEQCCDAWVVWALPRSAQAYATALLQTVDFLSGARPAVPMAASGIGHLSCLKRRLTMIMQASTPRGLSRAGRLAVFGLAAILLPLVPTRAQQAPPGPKDESQPAPQTVEDVLRLDDAFVFTLPQELRLALSADDDRRDDRDDDDDRDDPQPRRARSTRREADRGDDGGERPRTARVRVRELKEEVKESKNEAKDRGKDSDNESPEKREQVEKARAEVKEATEQLHKAVQRLAELEGGKGAKGVGVMIRMVGPDGRVMSSSAGELPGNFNADHFFRLGPHGQVVMPAMPGRPGQPGLPAVPHASMAGTPQPRGVGGRTESRSIELRSASSQATERRIDDLEKKLDRVLEELRSMKDDRGRR
jgi:beta-lactamase regulating signal transducer with metallopeptidase domain